MKPKKSQLETSLITTLKSARLKKHLSQKELAEKIGIPQSHISKIESGRINPTIAILIQVARIVDFELMAVPKKYMSVVEGLSRENTDNSEKHKPAYSLDDDNDGNGRGNGRGAGNEDGSGYGGGFAPGAGDEFGGGKG